MRYVTIVGDQPATVTDAPDAHAAAEEAARSVADRTAVIPVLPYRPSSAMLRVARKGEASVTVEAMTFNAYINRLFPSHRLD